MGRELAGTRLSQAPDWSGSIALSYDWDITDSLHLNLRTQASYTGNLIGTFRQQRLIDTDIENEDFNNMSQY